MSKFKIWKPFVTEKAPKTQEEKIQEIREYAEQQKQELRERTNKIIEKFSKVAEDAERRRQELVPVLSLTPSIIDAMLREELGDEYVDSLSEKDYGDLVDANLSVRLGDPIELLNLKMYCPKECKTVLEFRDWFCNEHGIPVPTIRESINEVCDFLDEFLPKYHPEENWEPWDRSDRIDGDKLQQDGTCDNLDR